MKLHLNLLSKLFTGKNYADGDYHQVNVEIGEITKIYTDTFPYGKSNDTIVHSKAKDLRYDLDEIAYYVGMPITERINTKGILMSTRNFKGCLNILSFNKKDIKLSESSFKSTPSVSFTGKFISGCQLTKPHYLKSFTSTDEVQQVFSHLNEDSFAVEFYYRTYLQNGVIFKSISTKKPSSIILQLRKDQLELTVNLTRNISLVLTYHEENTNDGTWRKIHVGVLSKSVTLSIDKETITRDFESTHKLSFPYELIFGGFHESMPGMIGCIKDVNIGKDRTLINSIIRIDKNLNFEEEMCSMKDLCFPSRPCKNSGKCIQTISHTYCDCSSTGYTGPTCEIEDVENYHQSCDAYYKAGYQYDGIYTINPPGKSAPFKVKCNMKHELGPVTIIETNLKNKTFVFTGTDFDKEFYYYHVMYKANKQQIADLITSSKNCRQYVRYNCYQSTLLNSNDKLYLTSQLGVRWFSRVGSERNYWDGNRTNSHTCQCGRKGKCSQPKLKCNCDIRDKEMRFDEGFIKESDDLPISKLRISISSTSHRSSFQIGPLECTGKNLKVSTINPTNKLKPSEKTATDTSNYIPTGNVAIKTISKGNAILNSNNTVIKNESKSTKFIIIDSKLLYIIIAAVVVLIILSIMLLVFKRRICCCYYENNAKPQIVELYKEELQRNNNASNKNILQVSNDVTVNVEGIVVPTARGMSSYPTSSSDSSVSTIDPGRYYSQEGDVDSFSNHDSKTADYAAVPKKSILKIKKDLLVQQHRGKIEETSSHTSSDSSTIARARNNPLTGFCKNYGDKTYGDKEFNYELDSREISPLKQKVLQLSTSSNRTASGGELYFHQDSNSMQSSSCTSSKESELNSDVDESDIFNTNSELTPLTRRQRSVRFSDEERSISSYRCYPNKKKHLNLEDEESEEFLFTEEPNKTLV